MAVKEIKIYSCDVCGKEFRNGEISEGTLKKVELPYKQVDCEGRGCYDSMKKFDLCEDCSNKLSEIVFSNFAVIKDAFGSVSVEKKF